ncbi:MAG: OmpA family protein [Undibacterium sp.]|uniref:OmpA family protein n=1 Tax=Undibacterium sp. TaxID=1914977 RepID=UPI00271C15D6|nr:OmpA family protein [Undibacterium sp.]MDO8654466.1 OmpA family protein [Undibacterium sp.]
MKKTQFTPVLLAISVFVAACSSMPKTTSLLDQTRIDYVMAQNNPQVMTYATSEMKQASDALAQANDAANNNDSLDKIDKLAYLAKQKIALTQEVAKQKSAEAEVANAGKERDQIRLDQRTNEANRANVNAEQSKLAAQIAQGETAEAQRQAQEAQARAAQLESQLSDLAAKKTERGIIITLGDVLFGTDQARLNPDGMRTAQKLADILQQNPQRTVLVEGFTDSTGSAEHNQELSERRATAVRSALQLQGVNRDRIAVRGYGEAFPVAANDTAQNRQLNRRVEIILSDANGKITPR